MKKILFWKTLGTIIGGGAILTPITLTTSCGTSYTDGVNYTDKGHPIKFGPKGGVIDSTTGYYYKGHIYSAQEMRNKSKHNGIWIGLGVAGAAVITVGPILYRKFKSPSIQLNDLEGDA